MKFLSNLQILQRIKTPFYTVIDKRVNNEEMPGLLPVFLFFPWKCMDCVSLDVLIFKTLSNSEYQHINLDISLNSRGSERVSLEFQSFNREHERSSVVQ